MAGGRRRPHRRPRHRTPARRPRGRAGPGRRRGHRPARPHRRPRPHPADHLRREERPRGRPDTPPSARCGKPSACCGAGSRTVRDVGGADHGMARAIDEGLAVGPRLMFGGKALSRTGGHGDVRPLSDDTLPCCQSLPAFARVADGVDAVRAAARDEFRKGAAHLKMLISGGVASPPDEVSAVQYTDEEIRAAVIEAENHNRYVTVHGYHPRGVNRALRAGVRCVEHGNLPRRRDHQPAARTRRLPGSDAGHLRPDGTARQAVRHGRTVLPKVADVHEAGLSALERAHKAGVNLVYGSDLLGPSTPP
ncbi:amidohydrolase family protein [Streptomyces sp. L7]